MNPVIINLAFCLAFFASTCLVGQVPTVSDCLGAIAVCSDLYIENDSPVGAGNYTNEFTSNNCVSVEQNSVWYIFTVQEDGDFGFVLTPNAITDDYDWSLFNLTGVTCQDLQTNPDLIASCNAAGGGTCNGLTGATGTSIYNFQNFGCGNFPPTSSGGGFTAENAFLNVSQGETFALCIINWTGSVNGYTLDFGVSQVDVFDGLDPLISAISLPATNRCIVESFPITFSEYVSCASAQIENITIQGPGGPYMVTLEGDNCNEGGLFEKDFLVVIDPPLQAPGAFTVAFEGQVQDLCGNQLEGIDFFFTLDDFQSEGEYELVDQFCSGDSTVLTPNSDEIESFKWNDGSTSETLIVSQGGLYTVELEGECIYRIDTFEVNLFQSPEISEVSLVPSACTGASGSIEIIEVSGEAPFTYSIDNGIATENTLFSNLAIGFYEIEIFDGNDCSSTELYEIVQTTSDLTIGGKISYEVTYPDDVILEPVISGAYSRILWDNQSGLLSCIDCLNPTIISPTDMVVQLEVEDEYGCLHYQEFTIRVRVERNFYAPTIFTPNEDNRNDRFFLGAGPEIIRILQLSIYSRWGEELFNVSDAEPNDPEAGWDGTKLGQDMQNGVYHWVAQLEYVDGYVNEVRGTLMLVK